MRPLYSIPYTANLGLCDYALFSQITYCTVLYDLAQKQPTHYTLKDQKSLSLELSTTTTTPKYILQHAFYTRKQLQHYQLHHFKNIIIQSKHYTYNVWKYTQPRDKELYDEVCCQFTSCKIFNTVNIISITNLHACSGVESCENIY